MNQIRVFLLLTLSTLFAVGCDAVKEGNSNTAPPPTANTNMNSNTALPNTSTPQGNTPKVTMFTLPMLGAFLSDENFTADLKKRLQLNDNQVQSLQKLVADQKKQTTGNYEESTSFAERQSAEEKITAAIGAEKTQQLASLVSDYWSGKSASTGSTPNTTPTDKTTAKSSINAVPTDTRIVVNAPAYRMDVFKNGELIQSYKVGIGYPEFPLPEGMRMAKEIIFNPSWVPPDEPWVESSTKVKAGEKVEAGSKLNPLGIAKIPIGLPSLIHGGKNVSKIGGFASHGCVGLTDAQLRDFIITLAKVGNTEVTPKDIAEYGKNKTETKNVKLSSPVPVELRYETIVVEDGKLHIYRDVYDMDTNTEENLRIVLAKYGVKPEDLSEAERSQVMSALKEMSRDAKGRLDDKSAESAGTDSKDQTKNGKPGSTDDIKKASTNKQSKEKDKKIENTPITRTVKGAKEQVIEIAALKGKGYPAPVALNTGGAKNSTPIVSTRRPK